MTSTKQKKYFIRFRKFQFIVFSGSLLLLLSYFPIISRFEHGSYIWATCLVVTALYLFGSALITLGYHLVIDTETNKIREIFFGKIWREISIDDVNSVERRWDIWDATWTSIIFVLQLALLFTERGGAVVASTTGYGLKGNFNFNIRFPLIPVDFKFLDGLIELKGNSLLLDSYFAPVISKQSRETLQLGLSTVDKVGNVLGYSLYTILFIILAPIILLVLIVIFGSIFGK